MSPNTEKDDTFLGLFSRGSFEKKKRTDGGCCQMSKKERAKKRKKLFAPHQ